MKSSRVDPIGVLGGVLLPLAAAAAVFVAAAVWEPRLPNPIAEHWGAAGTPNRFGDLWSNTGMMVVIVLAVGLGCGCVAMFARALLMMRQIMLVVALTVTALLTSTWVGSLAAQLDLEDAAAARLPFWPTGLFTVLGLGVGLLLARQLRDGRVRVRVTERPPAHLPRHAVTHVRDSFAAPTRMQVFFVLPLIALAVVLGFATWTVWPFVIFIPIAVFVLMMMRARIDVDGSGIKARIGGLLAFDLATSEIEKAEVTQVSGWDYGGYGLRTRGKKQYALVFQRGPAVAITTGGGYTFTITTEDAEHIAGILNSAADQERS